VISRIQRTCLKLSGMGLCSLALGLTPALAHAGSCVKIDEERDILTPEERNSARSLFEEVLAEEHQ